MNLQTYLIYKVSTGEADRSLRCSADQLSYNLRPGEAAIECDWVPDGTRYVANGQLRQCGDYQLDALPLPCTVRIEGVEYECRSQPMFEFDVPGEYQIEVDAGPRFLRKEFTYAYPPRGR